MEPVKLGKKGLIINSKGDDVDNDDGSNDPPETFDMPVLANILVGSILDNAGSTGLVPIRMSPLMFDVFLGDFLERGEEPIMSIDADKWLTVCVAYLHGYLTRLEHRRDVSLEIS